MNNCENSQNFISAYMSDCTLCPRNCHADRQSGKLGFCRQTADLFCARAALHFWEEPSISGTSGSGAVFFSGCNLQCIFCQNHNIALGDVGYPISVEKLADIFLNLQAEHANNINLVTGTHYIPQIAVALRIAKANGLTIPIVYNTSGYEKVSSLALLDGLVDIYLPDMKYYDSELSSSFSRAEDYFIVAKAAIAEMVRQVGSPCFDEASGLMRKGVIVRHLVLPSHTKDSKKILRFLQTEYGNKVYISIMNQYTPVSTFPEHPELNHKLSKEEYERVLTFADRIGIEQGYVQEGETAKESFIPEFNGEGL